jgi:tmRNA-binding protein
MYPSSKIEWFGSRGSSGKSWESVDGRMVVVNKARSSMGGLLMFVKQGHPLEDHQRRQRKLLMRKLSINKFLMRKLSTRKLLKLVKVKLAKENLVKVNSMKVL